MTLEESAPAQLILRLRTDKASVVPVLVDSSNCVAVPPVGTLTDRDRLTDIFKTLSGLAIINYSARMRENYHATYCDGRAQVPGMSAADTSLEVQSQDLDITDTTSNASSSMKTDKKISGKPWHLAWDASTKRLLVVKQGSMLDIGNGKHAGAVSAIETVDKKAVQVSNSMLDWYNLIAYNADCSVD